MLAQNFKTPTELGITDAEFNALVKVLGMLERGELRHVPAPEESSEPVDGLLFNMNDWSQPYECGTVHCIGGWAERIGGFEFCEAADTGLWRLFYPYGCDDIWKKITTDQAAIALRNYLTTGEPSWAEALA